MPGRARLTARPTARLAAGLAAAGLAIGAAGCGAPQPQAPVGVASKVSSALTTIAAMCGESYRAQAFSSAPDLGRLEREASSSAQTLADDARRHPQWIYQGATLAQLRAQARARLTECKLRSAARLLTG
jgi:hypothetical protein